MATHSSVLAWRIPWTEEPGGLQSMGLQKVRQDRATFTFTFSQGHSAGRLDSLQGTYDIKGWHGSFQDLAHLKKLHPTLNGISLHQFNLRRIPLAKSPSSSSLYPASGCTAGRQSDFMPGFPAFPSQKSSGFITSNQFYQQKM